MNHAGVERKRLDYDGFGRVTSTTDTNDTANNYTVAVDQLFRYTGRYTDEDTGFQNNLHRWYDSKAGRWLSEDPIGFAGGDENLYRYVGNEPTGKVDPNGLEEDDTFVAKPMRRQPTFAEMNAIDIALMRHQQNQAARGVLDPSLSTRRVRGFSLCQGKEYMTGLVHVEAQFTSVATGLPVVRSPSILVGNFDDAERYVATTADDTDEGFFASFRNWWKGKADDAVEAAPKSVDLMDEVGQLGAELFPKEKIPALVKYLDRRGIYLHKGINGSFDGVRGGMTLPRNPTRLNVRH